ncbi:hypothetical protein M0R36_01410 [bacterium]|jgi:hypothetical protein|nr:hypothetical protein [bacterium]
MNRTSFLKKNLMRIKAFLHIFYYPQVKIEFPIDILKQYINYDWKLPEDYKIRSPDNTVDKQAWADLLNSDGEFGIWNKQRIEDEIISHMIAPDTASLLYYKDKLIGCSSSLSDKRTKDKVGIGMFLFLSKSHRSKKGLSFALTFRTLSFFARENFVRAFAYTDPHRLSALYLYLSTGIKPRYNSIFSIIQWYKIKKRLNPLLKRIENKKR